MMMYAKCCGLSYTSNFTVMGGGPGFEGMGGCGWVFVGECA